MSAHHVVFRNQLDPIDCTPTSVDGVIPSELHGSFLRNGPGQQTLGSDQLTLLDAHGFVVAAQFAGGSLRIVGRATESAARQLEQGQPRQTLRYPFTNRPGGVLANCFRLDFANTAAHDVYGFGGEVYASDILGHYALDRTTLATLGPSPLDALREQKMDQISPMPRLHPNGQQLTAYHFRGGTFGADTLTLFELGVDGQLSERRVHQLEGSGNAIHDVAFTSSHDVVIRWGRVSPLPVLLGLQTIGGAIQLPPGETLVYLLPRRAGEQRVVVRLPRQQTFHLFNAFRRDGELVLDVVAYGEGVDFTKLHPERFEAATSPIPVVRRHVVTLATGAVTTREYDAHGEAPDVDQRRHGLPHRFGYVAGVDTESSLPIARGAFTWANSVLKVDFESGAVSRYQAPAGAILSPPSFVPRGEGEDEGYLLSWLTTEERSAVVVLDAKDLERGPIGTAWFEPPLPAVSHTSWMPA